MKLIIQRWGYSDMLVEIIKEQIEMCCLPAICGKPFPTTINTFPNKEVEA